MNLFEFFQFFSTAGLLILIWLVQLLIYPAFFDIDKRKWVFFHKRHCLNISYVVIPLMLAEAIGAFGLLLNPPIDNVLIQQFIVFIIFLIWLSTFFIQVPLHRRLSQNCSFKDIANLLYTNWIRTFLWSLKAFLVALIELN
jgi:hypothetical protein